MIGPDDGGVPLPIDGNDIDVAAPIDDNDGNVDPDPVDGNDIDDGTNGAPPTNDVVDDIDVVLPPVDDAAAGAAITHLSTMYNISVTFRI
jgi:hypothetical protein